METVELHDDQGASLGRLRLYQDNVLVRMRHHEKREEKTPGGIIIPEQAREPNAITGVEAYVVAVGPGWYPGWRCGDCGKATTAERTHFEEPPFQPGDTVIVESSVHGDRVMIGGEEHRIIRVANVIGVVEE